MNQRPVRAANSPARRNGATDQAEGSRFAWDGMARSAVVGIFVLLVFAALYWAQPVVLPAVLALVVGIVLTPIQAFAKRYGLPYWLTAFLLVSSMFAGLTYAMVLLAGPLGEWLQKAPELGAVLRENLRFLDRPIAAFNALRESIAGPSADRPAIGIDPFSMLVQPVLAVLTPAVGQTVIFFATLFFFLAGRETLRLRFLTFWAERKARLGALQFMNEVEATLVSYFAVIAFINLVLAILLVLVAYLVGLPNPLVWGILGFLLNFLPYIGPASIIVMLFAVGLMVFQSLVHALAAPLFYLVASIIEGEFVTPGIVGLRLALSPLLVFLAVAFWTWFWGPLGALLAVPLLIMGTIALQHAFPKDEVRLPD